MVFSFVRANLRHFCEIYSFSYYFFFSLLNIIAIIVILIIIVITLIITNELLGIEINLSDSISLTANEINETRI